MEMTVDITVVCTVEDQFGLIDLARKEVESSKPRSEWKSSYPEGVTEALQQLIRTAIASRFLESNVVSLHKIGHNVRSVDLPELSL